MSKNQRKEVVQDFTAEKKWILITTDLMARGLDFPKVGSSFCVLITKVKLVINYDIPTSLVTYIHRTGRTGRAGFTGKAITFYTKDDK